MRRDLIQPTTDGGGKGTIEVDEILFEQACDGTVNGFMVFEKSASILKAVPLRSEIIHISNNTLPPEKVLYETLRHMLISMTDLVIEEA